MPTNFAIQCVPRVLDQDAKVVELIDRDLNGWDKGMLESLISIDEVNTILSILISPNQSYAVIWKGMKNGIFTSRVLTMQPRQRNYRCKFDALIA